MDTALSPLWYLHAWLVLAAPILLALVGVVVALLIPRQRWLVLLHYAAVAMLGGVLASVSDRFVGNGGLVERLLFVHPVALIGGLLAMLGALIGCWPRWHAEGGFRPALGQWATMMTCALAIPIFPLSGWLAGLVFAWPRPAEARPPARWVLLLATLLSLAAFHSREAMLISGMLAAGLLMLGSSSCVLRGTLGLAALWYLLALVW